MTLDIEKYLPELDSMDAPPIHKEEIIRAVWCLMESRVDQAFGVHPVQQAKKAARKPLAEIPKRRIDSNRNKVAKRFNHQSNKEEIKRRKA